MIPFKVDTGCREQEVCGLRWEWEVKGPELDTSVFLIPTSAVKNREERLVVLNRVAKSGVDEMRDVHDLLHTFGRSPRAAGVSFEDRQDLLGHRSGRITTHYAAAQLTNLIEAANRVCAEGSRKSPALMMLKRKAASA